MSVEDAVKAGLPFKLDRTPFAGKAWLTLEYEKEVKGPDGSVRRIPFRIGSESPEADAIVTLMEMYWDLEGQVEGLKREREVAVRELAEVKGELIRERARSREWKRQAQGGAKTKEEAELNRE